MVDLRCSHYTHKNSSYARRQCINSLNSSNHITNCMYSKSSCGTPWKHTYLILKLKKRKTAQAVGRNLIGRIEGLEGWSRGGWGTSTKQNESLDLRQHQWEWRKRGSQKDWRVTLGRIARQTGCERFEYGASSGVLQVMFEALEGKSCLKGA